MKEQIKEQKEYSNNKMKIVGADASTVYADSVTDKCPNRLMYVCPLPHRNTQTGITLIALVITIIVLLVLGVVSIKLLVDHGIIGHANNATKGYTVEQEKELIAEGYANYKMAKYAATDTTDVDKLQQYFDLGIDNIAEETEDNEFGIKFINNDIINDAETSLQLIGYGEEGGKYFNRLSYKNKTYKMMVEDEETMKIKIEFESMLVDSNEETDDLKRLRNYFKDGGMVEEKYNGHGTTIEFKDNDIIKGSTEIKLLGKRATGYSIQYKNYIYIALLEDTPQSCAYNIEVKDVEIEASTFVLDMLNVQGAKTRGDETKGWVVTFDKSGNVYTLLSNGKIQKVEAQNPENPETKVNLKELIDTKYAENSDPIIGVAHMEEGNEANQKTADVYIVNKKFILYTSSGNSMYVMPLENTSVQEFAKALNSSSTTINANITELKENIWYKAVGSTNIESYSIILETIMPNSIIFNFSDEHIGDKEVYNAIINNARETPTRTKLKELADSKFSENNTEEIKVAYIEDGSLMHNELASIRIVKKDNNTIIIYNSQNAKDPKYDEKYGTYFMTTENTNTKELSTVINREMDKRNIQGNRWYKIGSRPNSSIYFPSAVIQVQMPQLIINDFAVGDVLERELYFAIIENISY